MASLPAAFRRIGATPTPGSTTGCLAAHRGPATPLTGIQPPGPLGRAAALLRDGPFRRLLLAAALFYVVRTGEVAVLGWLMFDVTGSPSRVALVGVVRMRPMVLFGLGIGSHRRPRLETPPGRLRARARGGRRSPPSFVAVAAGAATPLHLYLAVFASGIGFATDFSAHRALMAHLAPRTAFGSVAALDTTALTGSFVVGPGAGRPGNRQHSASPAPMRCCWPWSAARWRWCWACRATHPAGLPARRLPLVTALRAVAANRTVLAVLLITMVMNACAFPYQFMLPVIARDELAVGPVAYGLLGSAAGLGALFSALAAGAVPPRLAGRVFSGGSLLLLSCIFVFALSRSYPLSFAVLFVGGFGFASFAVLQTSVVLQGVPPELRGRALGAVTLGIGSQPFGALALGGLAEAAGAPLAVAGMAGLGLVLVLAVSLALRTWRPPRPDGVSIA